MLKIQHLTKTYGDKKAVDDLSLEIRPGEIYGFIGHNGAGKTTTIKACCGLLQFDSGEITVDGVSVCNGFNVPACRVRPGQKQYVLDVFLFDRHCGCRVFAVRQRVRGAVIRL